LGGKRIGKVDSEAAFHLISAHIDEPHKELGELNGRAALAWIRVDRPRELHLARVEGSPLALGQTKNGTLIFASTMDILKRACEEVKIDLTWEHNVGEYMYMVVRNGVLQDAQSIVRKRPAKPQYSWEFNRKATTPRSAAASTLFTLP
jgi:hypothetical protein